jgi:hypothetical protein
MDETKGLLIKFPWQSTFLTFYLESWAFVISVSGLSLWAETNGGDILIPN